MGGKKGHLTDEEAIEEQDDRLEETGIAGFTDQNRADLIIGAKAGNLRIYHHSLNPQKQQLASKRVVFTRGACQRRFRSVSEAVESTKLSRHRIESAIARETPLEGWKVEYSNG